MRSQDGRLFVNLKEIQDDWSSTSLQALEDEHVLGHTILTPAAWFIETTWIRQGSIQWSLCLRKMPYGLRVVFLYPQNCHKKLIYLLLVPTVPCLSWHCPKNPWIPNLLISNSPPATVPSSITNHHSFNTLLGIRKRWQVVICYHKVSDLTVM